MDDAESIRAIHAALDYGINFFDSAANYGTGHSERILGQALEGRRQQAVITTKFGFYVMILTQGESPLRANICM